MHRGTYQHLYAYYFFMNGFFRTDQFIYRRNKLFIDVEREFILE